jgi:hypothetical protein
MRVHSHQCRRFASFFALTVGVLTIVCPASASAHVKWFATFNVAATPRPLVSVLSPNFGWLFLISVVGLLGGCLIERTRLGFTLGDALNRLTAVLRSRSEELLRACAGGFFVSLWVLGNVILTPELKTSSSLIPWLQAAIAIGLFWRPTMILSGLGIVALYVIGVANYGVFHLLDYPIFLGLAAFFILSSVEKNLFGLRPIDVARWGAGITLMWASVEKWAYPDWTYPLLAEHPNLAIGWEPSLYMTAAGVIEFGLAFGLIWTPLVRRLAAIVLSAMFISAIFEFGKVDAIGHLMIIAILIAVAADDSKTPHWRPAWAPILYGLALVVTLAAYYGVHAVMFGAA